MPPSRSSEHRAVVLLSGGIDSAACLHLCKQQSFRVAGLHVAYGQPAERQEVVAARRIARHYRIPLSIIRIEGARRKTSGEVAGRNALLILAAVTELKSLPATVAIGVHAGTTYYDCSNGFMQSVQRLVDGYCDGAVRIFAPFIDWTKSEIWEYCLEQGVPVKYTYSCERGRKQPCGQCLSCRDLEALRAR